MKHPLQAAALLALAPLLALCATAITPNHVDDFQDGTLQNWAGGSVPTNIANGGPGGAGDRYLQISASGNLLGTYNKVQWAGNYAAAGVKQVQMNLNNFVGQPLSLRITLLTPGCGIGATACTAWATTNATALASGSGWVTASFSIEQANLTRVLGSDSYAASMANIERLLIRHDPGPPTAPGPGSGTPVTATLGIDNVVPEPPGPLGLAAGAGLLGALGWRRHRARA